MGYRAYFPPWAGLQATSVHREQGISPPPRVSGGVPRPGHVAPACGQDRGGVRPRAAPRGVPPMEGAHLPWQATWPHPGRSPDCGGAWMTAMWPPLRVGRDGAGLGPTLCFRTVNPPSFVLLLLLPLFKLFFLLLLPLLELCNLGDFYRALFPSSCSSSPAKEGLQQLHLHHFFKRPTSPLLQIVSFPVAFQCKNFP